MTSKRQLERRVSDIEGEDSEEGMEEFRFHMTFVDKDLNVTGGRILRTFMDGSESERYELGPEEAKLIAGDVEEG
ncbi:hypothetical protein AKJ40_01155 [candidate division MSBL1 archaeon SCGC-AAA259M10]|uniref:Uncharacterized protein n=1 Tax=candidate division MSBL1 archaeon SCGC-AAA259M10 TaxID=1698270 RepID=A0A133V2D2_9EURY|nr:hypothetical protein AKJ40_01155 [candidate division MSBL1 archaeon SCGC-AAA259M10]